VGSPGVAEVVVLVLGWKSQLMGFANGCVTSGKDNREETVGK